MWGDVMSLHIFLRICVLCTSYGLPRLCVTYVTGLVMTLRGRGDVMSLHIFLRICVPKVTSYGLPRLCVTYVAGLVIVSEKI